MPNQTHGPLRRLHLLTTGRLTGEPRRSELFYAEDGPNLVIVGSNDGQHVDPAWWRNLQAQPDAEVEVDGGVRPVRARQATTDEAAALYARFVAAMPQYADYQERTTRPIPVVILEPR